MFIFDITLGAEASFIGYSLDILSYLEYGMMSIILISVVNKNPPKR